MNMKPTIELTAEHIKYYSQYDEEAFFAWLGKITCVTEIGGTGYALSMIVQPDLVDQGAIRDLLALFHRYHIDKTQLLELVRPEFASWFHDQEKYWNKKK